MFHEFHQVITVEFQEREKRMSLLKQKAESEKESMQKELKQLAKDREEAR